MHLGHPSRVRSRGEIEQALQHGDGHLIGISVVEKAGQGELEAYLICKFAGWEIVPETVPTEKGIRQRAPEHIERFPAGEFPGIVYLRSRGAEIEDLNRIVALDLIVSKAQCQCGLDLSTPIHRRVYALSNEKQGDTRDNVMVKYFSGLPVPKGLRLELKSLVSVMNRQETFKGFIQKVGAERASQLRARATRLSETDLFPISL